LRTRQIILFGTFNDCYGFSSLETRFLLLSVSKALFNPHFSHNVQKFNEMSLFPIQSLKTCQPASWAAIQLFVALILAPMKACFPEIQ